MIKERLIQLSEALEDAIEFRRISKEEDMDQRWEEEPARRRRMAGEKIGSILIPKQGKLVGGFIGAPSQYIRNRMARRKAVKATEGDLGPPELARDIKSSVPIVTSRKALVKELKSQGVGPIKRNVQGIVTIPGRLSGPKGSAFVSTGTKGVISTSKKTSRPIVYHEEGHGRDYVAAGGEKDFKKQYKKYRKTFVRRKTFNKNTMLPEERAWDYAEQRAIREGNQEVIDRTKRLRKAALETYGRAGKLQPYGTGDKRSKAERIIDRVVPVAGTVGAAAILRNKLRRAKFGGDGP